MFKTVMAYKLERPVELDEDRISEREISDPQPLALTSAGFTQPVNDDRWLVNLKSDFFDGEASLLGVEIRERVLPASAVNKAVLERTQEIEEKEERKVSRKERIALKDAVLQEMLPRAFIKPKANHLVLITKAWIVIDCSSPKTAEDILSLIREITGSLPVIPFGVAPEVLKDLLINPNQAYETNFYCKLVGMEKEQSTFKDQDLDVAIKQSTDNNYPVVELGLRHIHQHIIDQFVLTQDKVKSIIYDAEQLNESMDDAGDDPIATKEATAWICSVGVIQLLDSLDQCS